MSSFNCCFLTCIQVSQEAGMVVWCSHLFKNFPQFVIHTVKSFSIVNEAEVDFFWKSLIFSMIQWMSAAWSLDPLPFLNPAWTSGNSVHVLLKPSLENFEHYFASVWDECNHPGFEQSLELPFFGIGMKTDQFQSCGHCWAFQICGHIECGTFQHHLSGFEISQLEFHHLY